MSREDRQAGEPAGRDWTHDWRVRAAGAVVVLALLAWAAHTFTLGAGYTRLLRAEPDASATDPRMASFAAQVSRPVYAKRCASCHGADMKGDRARGIPNLVDNDWLYGTGRVAELEKTILYGIRSGHPRSWNLADMPAFGEQTPYWRYKVTPLQPQQIRDLVEYLRFLGGLDSDKVAAARGAPIFADSGQCFDCHANDGAGDSAIGAPDLADKIWLYGDGSRESVFQSIAHGHRGSCPAWATRLKPGQVRAMAVFIHNAAAAAAPPAKTAAAPVANQGKPS